MNLCENQKATPRFVKVLKTTDPLNWWYNRGIVGKTFEVLDISEYNFVQIEYDVGYYGWIPIEVCEVNPHIKRVK